MNDNKFANLREQYIQDNKKFYFKDICNKFKIKGYIVEIKKDNKSEDVWNIEYYKKGKKGQKGEKIDIEDSFTTTEFKDKFMTNPNMVLKNQSNDINNEDNYDIGTSLPSIDELNSKNYGQINYNIMYYGSEKKETSKKDKSLLGLKVGFLSMAALILFIKCKSVAFSKSYNDSYKPDGKINEQTEENSFIPATVKTGSLNQKNYYELNTKNIPQTNSTYPQQGFCLVDDQFIVYIIHSNINDTCRAILVDMATMLKCDEVNGIIGHGNASTYDSKTGDVIIPEDKTMKLLHVNKKEKKFENVRTQKLPNGAGTSGLAFNEHNDLFVSNKNVFTREDFYSGGNPTRSIKTNPGSDSYWFQSCGSYGNQVYFCYFKPNLTGNVIVVSNIITGDQERVINDNMCREIEEADFLSDGTLVLCYGTKGTGFYLTDYNYNEDDDIDKTNVSAGRNNTVQQYTENNRVEEETRKYNNDVLNVKNPIDTQINMDNPYKSNREYRALQAACYDGHYYVVAQNRNYGSIADSSKGGRIGWIDPTTGKMEYSLEIGAEGGHMDAIAYDSERQMVLKLVNGGKKVLQINGETKDYCKDRYASLSKYVSYICYVPTLNQLVGYNNGSLLFFTYNPESNIYDAQKTVQIESSNLDKSCVQGIGTDGQVIYVAQSIPGSSQKSLILAVNSDGKEVEKHSLGDGFSGNKEVENVFGTPEGELVIACANNIYTVDNYQAAELSDVENYQAEELSDVEKSYDDNTSNRDDFLSNLKANIISKLQEIEYTTEVEERGERE